MRAQLSSVFLAVVILALAACVSTGTGGNSSSSLSTAVAVDFSAYRIVDLVAKTTESRAAVPDLLTNPQYKTTKMVFRRIAGSTVTLGAVNSEHLATVDEYARYGQRPVGEFLMGVFEVTQEQWQLLQATTPWSGIPTTIIPTPSGPGIPAYNLSADLVVQAINASGLPLRFPSGDEWEMAARTGGSTVFTWGDEISGDKPTAQAVTYLTATTFAPVGGKVANAFGLYDVHGNAWELVDDGAMYARGGSWLDPIVQTRCSNQDALPFRAAHPLCGVRLVFDP